MDDDLKEIADDFVRESFELLNGLEQDFVELEQHPGDQELINKIFRSFHTIKGGAGFLGFQKLVDLCHHGESLLNKARQKELDITPEVVDVILKAGDLAKAGLTAIQEGDSESIEVQDIISELDEAVRIHSIGPASAAKPTVPPPSQAHAAMETQQPTVPAATTEARPEPPAAQPSQPEPGPSPVAQSAAADPPPPAQAAKLLEGQSAEARKKFLGEILIELGIINEKELHEVLQEQKGHAEPPRLGDLLVKKGLASQRDINEALKVQQVAHKPEAKEVETTIRIDVDRLDEIMNLVGELVLSRNRLMKLTGDLEGSLGSDSRYEWLSETVAHLNIITTNLQMGIMKTRMQPIRRVLSKFPRTIRDIAKKRGKEVEFVVEGEDTELDKSVLDEIGDPLVHLVRNSIDHGLEDPETRLAAGKPPKGRIKLFAYQEGNRIAIAISDDGRGIDVHRIQQKALESGQVSQDEIQRMSRDEVLNLIFLPGFSTAQKVDDVSGRGVGMDVVKNNVAKLNGTIDIATEEGQGTTITLKLPLTIAIIQTLLVRETGRVFALPLTSVIEIAKLRPEEIQMVNRRKVLTLRDHILPLISLGERFRLKGGKPVEACSYVVVLGIAERRIGLCVEELLGGEEITIKSVGKMMADVPGIAGASITGDGRIVLVVDLVELFSEFSVGFHDRTGAGESQPRGVAA